MFVQLNEPHYARGDLSKPGAANRIASQHIARFWAVPVVEGRATVQGHPIDPDEVEDPHDAMDNIDQYEPEALGGRIAAQQGEFFYLEEESESPCVKCSQLWCSGALEDVCRQISGTDAELFAEISG